MKVNRTVTCKIALMPEQQIEIDATLKAFADACNAIADIARRDHTFNRVKLQRICYREIRNQFGLSANLTIRAIARVCTALMVPAKMHSNFWPTSIDYDARIFSFREWDWSFSLTLLHSRQRLKTKLGEWQRKALIGAKPTAAVLVKRRDGTYFLHVQLSENAPELINADSTLGVDLGRRRVAVDSDGTIYAADETKHIRQYYPKVRRSLQRRGTKGSKRALKRLSGRERRHQRHVNHVISRRIVDKAKSTARKIALEDLTGIFQRTRVRKVNRYEHKSWSFRQLRDFISYKAQNAGIPVALIDPAYTSKSCHVCGEIGHRNALDFSCTTCGFAGDADINAALNIAARGAEVTRPERAGGLLLVRKLRGFSSSRSLQEGQ